MFLSKDTPLVAVDIGSHSIKVAQLSLGKKEPELLNFGIIEQEAESIVEGVIKKPDEISDALSRLLKAEKIETKFTVSSLSGEAVIVKKIKVREMSQEDFQDRLSEEVDQYIPFDIDDVSLSFQILGPIEPDESDPDSDELSDPSEPQMGVLLVAVQKEIIDSRMDVLTAAGLRPVIMDLDVFAIVNALNLQADMWHAGSVALIDLGDSYTHMNILSNGVTYLSRDIPIGGGSITHKLMSKYDTPAKEAMTMKLGILPSQNKAEEVVATIKKSFEKILEEIGNTFEQYNMTHSHPLNKIILSGGGALIPGISHHIADHFKVPTEILDPLQSLRFNPKQFDTDAINALAPLSTVAIGLATRRFDHK
jgi:type IV pilus assembly protein PilM